jgi:hypothetical protein
MLQHRFAALTTAHVADTFFRTRRRCQASMVPGVTIRCDRRCPGSSLAPEPDGLTDRELRRDLNAAENAELARL